MILVFAPRITNRLQYIFGVVLSQLAGIDHRLTSSLDEFERFDGPRLAYSDQPLKDVPFIACRQLLFERGIRETELKVEFEAENPMFFLTYNKHSLFRFDIFAASFYLLSRYEEYLPYIKDKYDRFDAPESLAFKNGFLEKPVVNIWAEMLATALQNLYPQIQRRTNTFRFIPTYDVDAAYAYKNKGFVRTLGGFFKALRAFDFAEMKARAMVLAGRTTDPFDTYDLQLELQEKYRLRPIYFILFADYGINDKNIPTDNKQFQELVKHLADYAEIGIHPSYTSNNDSERLKKEVYKLGRVLNKDIRRSRQHFLKLYFPTTYRALMNLDITDDYTMGYASWPGFRAGICSPFPFYDLEAESEAPLTIHPFALMEGTLRDYLKLNPEQAVERARKLTDEVKAVNGTLITLWHNESLSNAKRWTDWLQVYIVIIGYATGRTPHT